MGKLAGAALQVALAAPLVLFLPAYYVYKLTTSLLRSLFPEDVAGKVVLITGASSGIGEVCMIFRNLLFGSRICCYLEKFYGLVGVAPGL